MHAGRKYEVMHAFQGQNTIQPCKESLGGVVTAKQTQHCLWEGRGCEIQPNGGVDFGKAVHLRVLSNSTVPLPFDGRGCKIQLNGGVHFSWGINPMGQLTWRNEG